MSKFFHSIFISPFVWIGSLFTLRRQQKEDKLRAAASQIIAFLFFIVIIIFVLYQHSEGKNQLDWEISLIDIELADFYNYLNNFNIKKNSKKYLFQKHLTKGEFISLQGYLLGKINEKKSIFNFDEFKEEVRNEIKNICARKKFPIIANYQYIIYWIITVFIYVIGVFICYGMGLDPEIGEPIFTVVDVPLFGTLISLAGPKLLLILSIPFLLAGVDARGMYLDVLEKEKNPHRALTQSSLKSIVFILIAIINGYWATHSYNNSSNYILLTIFISFAVGGLGFVIALHLTK